MSESCGEVCGDDRFDLIDKAKKKLLECTNIESSPEEVAVLDNVLFRCWQMGWLDKLRNDNSRYFELFGTPERAARTLREISVLHCEGCVVSAPCKTDYESPCLLNDYGALLEWLRGDDIHVRVRQVVEHCFGDAVGKPSRYSELFGTPERVAWRLTVGDSHADCGECVIREACHSSDMGCLVEEPDALLEWLRGDAE